MKQRRTPTQKNPRKLLTASPINLYNVSFYSLERSFGKPSDKFLPRIHREQTFSPFLTSYDKKKSRNYKPSTPNLTNHHLSLFTPKARLSPVGYLRKKTLDPSKKPFFEEVVKASPISLVNKNSKQKQLKFSVSKVIKVEVPTGKLKLNCV